MGTRAQRACPVFQAEARRTSAWRRGGASPSLDVALVPEREREQSPELAAPVLPARDVLVEEESHGLVAEEAVSAQHICGERVARERLELAGEPRGGRNRETALATVHDLCGQQQLRRLAQQPLLRQAAHLVARGQRERKARHDGIEERHARLERV